MGINTGHEKWDNHLRSADCRASYLPSGSWRGYSDELPLERHYRDAIALSIYEGTSNVQRLILSRSLLGRDEGTQA